MSLLSQHIIQGAAHDSSARTPPPRCHPDTRVKLIARITAWFEGQVLQELLLWITGPAGVGKSAVVQTFAEYLAKSKSLGASVFISRPNGRNDPHGVFITIAYQLATRIEAYRDFIVERLSLDPELLRGDMQAQFTNFIVEPFVERKIGEGGKRWGILLDGLDELRGEDAQCNIIQLVGTFAHEHHDVPLIWIIASRPESHISNTFDDDEVLRSYRSEHIPIDSTEACGDVDRFLRSSFKTVRKKYRQSAPSDWPSDTDFLKLTAAASGLFIYAEVVMHFIRDPDHGNPVSRLEVLLFVIDRSNAVPTRENPFVHLDALYHEIVSLIPSTLWPTAKQLLSLATLDDQSSFVPANFKSLRGMTILLNLSRHTIYACLAKVRSTLKIPEWKVAHKEGLMFFHASFADYLKDPSRSRDFHVGNFEAIDEGAKLNLLEIWNKCSGDDITTGMYNLFIFVTSADAILVSASVKSAWYQYCSKFDEQAPSRAVAKFHAKLFHDLVSCLGWMAYRILEEPTESLIYVELRKIHMAKLCYYFHPSGLVFFVASRVNDPQILRFNPELHYFTGGAARVQ
jgi:hypothetical protein